MILAVAEEAPMLLDEDVLQRAFTIVASASSSADDIAKMIDTSDRGKNIQLIVDITKSNGGMIDRSTLIKKLYRKMSKVELDMYIPTLIEANILKDFKLGKKQFYRIISFEE